MLVGAGRATEALERHVAESASRLEASLVLVSELRAMVAEQRAVLRTPRKVGVCRATQAIPPPASLLAVGNVLATSLRR